MFKILKNMEASSGELAEAYANTLKIEGKLEAERVEAKNEMLSLQVEAFGKQNKKLQAVKAKMDDLCLRIEALHYGQQQLKARIAERLHVEARCCMSN